MYSIKLQTKNKSFHSFFSLPVIILPPPLTFRLKIINTYCRRIITFSPTDSLCFQFCTIKSVSEIFGVFTCYYFGNFDWTISSVIYFHFVDSDLILIANLILIPGLSTFYKLVYIISGERQKANDIAYILSLAFHLFPPLSEVKDFAQRGKYPY